MSTIRVDPGTLRKAADDIARVAEELRAAGNQLHQSTHGAPGYDGQFGSQVAFVGMEALARIRMLADRLADRSAWLAARAEAFEGVDAAALQGLASIRQELLAWVHSQEAGPLELLLLESGLGGTPLAAELEALITRPPWLVAGTRPPWISPQAWNHMDREDRAEVLAEAKASLERFWGFYRDHLAAGIFPDVLVVFAGAMNLRAEPNYEAQKLGALGGTENSGRAAWDGQVRWDEEGQLWFHVSGDDIASGWVAAWQGGERPHMNLIAYSPYEDGGPWTPQVETSGYDQEGGWDLYQAGSQPQYLNVREVMRMAGVEGWQDYLPVNRNLCGELAVFEAVGVPLEEGFRACVEIPAAGEKTPSGYDVLRSDGLTSSYHLEHTFDALGFSPDARYPSLGNPIPELQGILLDEHRVAIVNVAIDDAGNLLPAVSKDKILHWVHVTNIRTVVAEDGAATTWVDYYNPYTNSTQTSSDAALTQSFLGTVVTAEPGG